MDNENKGFEKDFGVSDEGVRRAASELEKAASFGDEDKKEEVLENVTASSEVVSQATGSGASGEGYAKAAQGESEAMYGRNDTGTYRTETERMEAEFRRRRAERNVNYASGFGGSSGNDYDNENGYNGGANFYSSGNQDRGNGNKGMSIASMVCGILSVLCCCLGWFGLVLGIIAVVFGILSLRNNYSGREMAIAGIATGGCGVLLCVVLLIFASIASGLTNAFMKDSLDFYHFDLKDLNDIL